MCLYPSCCTTNLLLVILYKIVLSLGLACTHPPKLCNVAASDFFTSVSSGPSTKAAQQSFCQWEHLTKWCWAWGMLVCLLPPKLQKNQKVFCKSFFYEMILSFGHACFACLLPCKLPKKWKKYPKVFLQVIYKVVWTWMELAYLHASYTNLVCQICSCMPKKDPIPTEAVFSPHLKVSFEIP